MSQVVRVERPEAGIAVVTIDRPKALNALNVAVVEQLGEVFASLESEADLRAVVLAGAGGKAFVAGADISEMRDMTPGQAEYFAGVGQRVLDRIAAFPRPVIAAVGGFALGGGCELAMAADILIVGEKARLGQPEVNLGVIPGFGGTQRLVRRVGLTRALDLCLTGRIVKADEAVAIGLAARKAEGDVLEAALEIARTIAAKGPVAIQLAKRAIHENADGALAAGLAAERSLFGLCFATEDQTEGMTAFLEKRAAQFTGA